MTSKKNENRKTTAKGFIANPYTKTFDEFCEKIPYTRSLQKAIELVREEMALDNDVMISVTELEQEEIKRTVYNPQLVFENMVADYEYEETANESANEEQTVIPYTMYVYDAQYWAFDGINYHTDYVIDNSPLKMTKVDARAFLKISAENLSGSTIIGIHNDNREVETRYAIVNNSDLEKCVKA